MMSAGPEDAGHDALLERLIAALGDARWRVRKQAVDELAGHSASDIVAPLLRIFREQHRDLPRLNAALQILAIVPVDVVPALLSLLESGDADVQVYSALALGQRGDPRAIPALKNALADVDPNVRAQAIEALGMLKAAAAVDELLKIAESLQFELAFPAIDALRLIGDGRIAHRLLLLVGNRLLREPAIEALGELGDEEVVAHLLELISDDPTHLVPAAGAIDRIHSRHVDLYGDGSDVEEIVRGFAERFPLVATLQSAMVQAETRQRASLLTLLSWVDGDEVNEAVIQQLDAPEQQDLALRLLLYRRHSVGPHLLERMQRLRGTAEPNVIALFGKLGDPRFVPALLQHLTCEDEQVLAAALESLARIRDAASYAPAKRLLGHPSVMVRDAAAALLNSLGDERLAADLQTLLRDSNPLIRESAVKVAAYLGFAGCLDTIFELCQDPERNVRQAAIGHLPCLEDARVPNHLAQAIATDTPRVRAIAAEALAEVGGGQALPILERALGDEDVWVRYHAIRSLAKFDRQRSVANRLTRLAVNDPAMQVRIAAIEELAHYGPAMLPVLRGLAHDEREDIVQAALEALGGLRLAEVIPDIVAALAEGNLQLKIAAIRALGCSQQRGAVAPLEELALSVDQEIANEAITALGAVSEEASCEALLRLAEYPSKREAVIRTLVTNSPDVRALIGRLPALPLDVRRAVVEVFTRLRSPAGRDGLEAALVDSHPAVRYAAVAALARAKGTNLLPILSPEGDR